MATVSSSPSLNPASTPFFPGGGSGGGQFKASDEDRDSIAGVGSISRSSLGIGRQSSLSRERYSISPTEHKPVKSSPSPPSSQDRRDLWRPLERNGSLSEFQLAINEITGSRQSPALGGLQDRAGDGDSARGFAIRQRPLARELSMSAIPEVPPDGDDTLGRPHLNGLYQQNAPYAAMMGRARERLHTPPMAVEMGSRTSSFTSAQTHFVSSSPASSLDSGSVFAPGMDLSTSFEAQLKSSSLIHELFNRVDRYEHRMDRYEKTTRELQREIQDMGRKIDLLVERTLADSASVSVSAAPQFSDPFASSSAPSFSTPDLNGLGGPRASIVGNIAPNQPGPIDDLAALVGRFGSLSAATECHLGNITSGMPPNDILPRGSLVPSNSSPGMMGHGISNRPSPRIPGPPSRTWSVGNLDIPPLRGGSNDSPAGSLERADGGFRDKRRSATANMLQRDSSVVSSPPSTEFVSVLVNCWSNSSRLLVCQTDITNSSGCESGPTISKWDQLALAPELLRSLNAFG